MACQPQRIRPRGGAWKWTEGWSELATKAEEGPGGAVKRPLALEKAAVNGATYFRVQTGPFPSREAANDVCAKLKARNQDCLVVQR